MTKEKRAAGNKVLPKAGLNSFDWAFVQGSTAVIRLNFCAKNPAFGNTQTVRAHLKIELMVLKLINDYKDAYKKLIAEYPTYNELYKWEGLKNFQDNWDVDAADFGAMYDKSLTSTISNNLWASQYFFPKRVMLKFIELDTERVRSMFKELFNEELNIADRIGHFVYHCDQLRDELLKTHPTFQNHFHDGYRVISVYLCFRYPMNYTIYKYTEFKNFMEKVQAKSIPGTNEIDRFFKVMRTLYDLLAKDTELLAIHRRLRQDGMYFQGESLLLAQDFYWCCDRFDIDKYRTPITNQQATN